MPGKRGGFLRDAFHQIAIAADGVSVMVDDFVSGPVVSGGEPCLRNCHPHAIAEALPQWPGGNLDANCVPALGMAWCLAAPLAEAFEFVERQIVASEVQKAVEQH